MIMTLHDRSTLPVDDATRRQFLIGSASLVALLAGCSRPDAETLAPSGSGNGAFPVTIRHKFGSTEIAEEPQRVLSLGYQEHDPIFALGVTPIAVRYWFGDENDVIFPWAEDEAAGADPQILNMPFGELGFEKIAGLRPDLILGVTSGITQREYELLTQIAPTVAQSGEYIDFGTPWQETTLTIGQAIGRDDRADKLVAEVAGQFDAVREANPQWTGRSVVYATFADPTLSVLASADPRVRFFTSLGFQVPAEIDRLAGEQFYTELSRERVDLLDADLLVWDLQPDVPEDRATIESNPLFSQLEVMRDGRAIYVARALSAALNMSSVLSVPFALDGITPMLEAAMDGDTETVPGN